jgi:exodeoxyribonuclease VII small subunit
LSLAGDESKRRPKRATPESADARPFEEQLDELDSIVAALEEGKLPLDEALALYERGMKLAQACQRRLDEADLRVSVLRASGESGGDGGGEISVTFSLEKMQIEGA